MSERFKIASDGTYQAEQCSGRVRWRVIVGFPPTLQQLYTVTESAGGKPISRREEWRDVPFESD